MQEGEAVCRQWQPKSDKRSSGLFSVLRWFRGQGDSLEQTLPCENSSTSSSSESIASTCSSSDTVASFSFVSPGSYRPHGRAESPPRMYILPQPETDTYKARLAEREIRRQADHQLTLRTKYNLPTQENHQGQFSLPLMTKTTNIEAKASHRRAASESATYGITAQAHLHVRGKRRAPQPPLQKQNDNTARRKKRMAPQPPPTINPDIISNDSLKLEKGVLKPAKQSTENKTNVVLEVSQFAPRPWYKRNKINSDKKTDQDKRKSCNMSFLTNISELDRQTMEILERETLKMKYLRSQSQAPAFMKPKPTDNSASNSDSWISPKRRSARDLIAKFNAITGVSRTNKETIVQVETVDKNIEKLTKEEKSSEKIIEPKRSLPSSPVARVSPGVSNRPARTPWNCPRCKLHNEYWRIICRVCSAIKPYFDDFTTDKTKDIKYKNDKIEGSLVTDNELTIFGKQIFEKLPTNANIQSGSNNLTEISKPRYPVSNFDLLEQTSNGQFQRTNQVRKSASQSSVTIINKDENIAKPESKTNILDQILKDIKQNKRENEKTEANLQMLSFETERKEYINKEKNYFKTNNIDDKTKIEKMILGDEIKVEKPRYINMPNDSKDGNTKPEERNMKIIEKISFGNEINVTKTEYDTGELKQAEINENTKQDTSKKDEREMLKKMLIEMKNSLSKRSVNKIKEDRKNRVSVVCEEQNTEEDDNLPIEKSPEIIVITQETTYENIKVRKTDNPKAIKVSSGCQTRGVVRGRELTGKEAIAVEAAGYQLIGAKDFVGMSNDRLGEVHTYANVRDSESGEKEIVKNVDTSDLLRQLEAAIAGGQLTTAAELATRLAEMKVPCTVFSQHRGANITEAGISVDMYVEDRVSHRGPFPLRIRPQATVAELRVIVERQYGIPAGVQRWILGDRLAADDTATLSEHQVTADGCPVFLYLVQPQNEEKADINIPGPSRTKENVEKIIEEEKEAAPSSSGSSVTLPELLTLSVEVTTDDEEDIDDDVWRCEACTLLNPIATGECEACGEKRNGIEIKSIPNTPPSPLDEAAAPDKQTYLQLVHLDNEDLIRTTESFECLVCLAQCHKGDGVMLRECLHQFCRLCLEQAVELCEEAVVKCPYRDLVYSCSEGLQEREVRALVSPDVYERHLQRSVKQAESTLPNTYHCRTRDCPGWCLYEPEVNVFRCPACRRANCLTCRAIHEGLDCAEHQRRARDLAHLDLEARSTRDWLEEAVSRGEALPCPTCHVTLMKKWGCDWLRCTMCKTEICWVTRGPRWGPKGKGDTTAGCRCGINGQKCHPNCNYCH